MTLGEIFRWVHTQLKILEGEEEYYPRQIRGVEDKTPPEFPGKSVPQTKNGAVKVEKNFSTGKGGNNRPQYRTQGKGAYNRPNNRNFGKGGGSNSPQENWTKKPDTPRQNNNWSTQGRGKGGGDRRRSFSNSSSKSQDNRVKGWILLGSEWHPMCQKCRWANLPCLHDEKTCTQGGASGNNGGKDNFRRGRSDSPHPRTGRGKGGKNTTKDDPIDNQA